MLPVQKDSEATNRLMQSLNNEFPASTAVHSAVHSATEAARPAQDSRERRRLNRMQSPAHQEDHTLDSCTAQRQHDNSSKTWSFSDAQNNLWCSFGSSAPHGKGLALQHAAPIKRGFSRNFVRCNGPSTTGGTALLPGNDAVPDRPFNADCGQPQSNAWPHVLYHAHGAKHHPAFVDGRFSTCQRQPQDAQQGLCQLLDHITSLPKAIHQSVLHAQLASAGHGPRFQQGHEMADVTSSRQQSHFSDQLPATATSPPRRQQDQLATAPTSAERMQEPLSDWDMDAAVKRVRRRLTPTFDRIAAHKRGCTSSQDATLIQV